MDVKNTSVLIVDDNSMNLVLMDGYLKELGFDVRVAMDGEQALESVNLMAPDIILMDIHMPVMDGYETTRRLKANPETKSIPVIFVSALDEIYNKQLGFEAGGIDYMHKPVSFEELRLRIGAHLKLARKIKELEAFNKAMIERERRIIDLKKEINNVLQEHGDGIRYPEVQ